MPKLKKKKLLIINTFYFKNYIIEYFKIKDPHIIR